MVSVNQVKHFFLLDDANVTVKKIFNEKGQKEADLLLQYKGKDPEIIVSDRISPDKVIYAKITPAPSVELKQAVVQLNPDVVSSGVVLAGQDFLLDVLVRNYITLADTSVLQKFAAVHTYVGMTESDFYVKLAKSLALNFSRDINKFFKFYLATDVADATTYEEVTTRSPHTNTYTGVIISEQAQTADYVRGEVPVTTLSWDVYSKDVTLNGDDVKGFKVDETGAVAKDKKLAVTAYGDTVVSISNAYDIADTEYFCAGERGDQLRMAGYPNVIRTKYMIDVEKIKPDEGYATLDLAFYFVGRGISQQHSEKHILIASTDLSALKTLAKQLTDITVEGAE